MIPISLTLEGLYSYQQAQHIDFTQLTNARLFGIFGPTGSGKSSILEAISFALYGECERLHRNNRNYNMMNLRSKRLFIDFTFELSQGETQRYRFVAEGKRNSRQFEKISTIQRQAYVWEKEDWKPLTLTTAEPLLGLSYENFKRTIIIPQGKFQEFLLLGNRDRSLMLQEIFGLNKYELSGQVIALVRKNDQAIQTQEVLLQQYAAITPDSINELKVEQETLTQNKTIVEDDLAKLEKQREGLEQLKQAFERLASLQTQWEQLEKQLTSIKQREQRWQHYLTCLNHFKDPLARRAEYLTQLERLEASLTRRQQNFQQLQTALTEQQKSFQQVEKAYTHREELKQKEADLESLIQLKGQERVIENLQERVKNGAGEIQAAEGRLNTFRAEWQSWEAQIREKRSKRTDPKELLEMQQWYSERNHLQERLKQEEHLLRSVQKKISTAKQEKQNILGKTPLDPRQYGLSVQKQLVLLEEEVDRLGREQARMEKQVQQQLLQEQLSHLTDELKEGEPCPVCGATHHPRVHTSATRTLSSDKGRETLAEIQRQLQALLKTIPMLEVLHRQARELGQEQKKYKNGCDAHREALQKHQALFIWKDLTEDKMAEHLAASQALNTALLELEKKGEALRESIADEEGKINQFRPVVENLTRELNTKKGAYNSQKAAFKQIRYEEYVANAEHGLNELIADLRKQYREVESLYVSISNQLKEKENNLLVLQGEISSEENRKKEVARQLATLSQEIEAQIVTSDFTSIAQVQEILALSLNIDAEKEAINAYRQERTATKTSLRDLKAQIGDQQFDATAFTELAQRIQQLQEERSQLSQRIGGLIELQRQQQKQLKEKKAIKKYLKELKLRAENLKVLQSLFRGNGFVNYISTMYLENLCAAANERFMKLARNALSLEVDQDNNFHVRDRLHEGRRRSIRTLSGGQTFQAALCLALALADQVHQQAQSEQNFFFLDEGFGSQDKDSLRTIFQTLKSLRKENRIVGVISHVEELQQEIDTFLQVENDAEMGSRVVGSWE